MFASSTFGQLIGSNCSCSSCIPRMNVTTYRQINSKGLECVHKLKYKEVLIC